MKRVLVVFLVFFAVVGISIVVWQVFFTPRPIFFPESQPYIMHNKRLLKVAGVLRSVSDRGVTVRSVETIGKLRFIAESMVLCQQRGTKTLPDGKTIDLSEVWVEDKRYPELRSGITILPGYYRRYFVVNSPIELVYDPVTASIYHLWVKQCNV